MNKKQVLGILVGFKLLIFLVLISNFSYAQGFVEDMKNKNKIRSSLKKSILKKSIFRSIHIVENDKISSINEEWLFIDNLEKETKIFYIKNKKYKLYYFYDNKSKCFYKTLMTINIRLVNNNELNILYNEMERFGLVCKKLTNSCCISTSTQLLPRKK